MKNDLAEERTINALYISLTAFLLVYTLSHLFSFPKIFFMPVDKIWTFQPTAGAVKMGYYGLLLNGFIAAAIVFSVARIPSIADRLDRPSIKKAITWANLTALLSGFTYFFLAEIAKWGFQS